MHADAHAVVERTRVNDTGAPTRRPGAARLRVAFGGLAVALLGAAPHVLHHAGPLAGAAIVGGLRGTLLFGVLGFLATIPMLRKLRRHTGSWRAPAAVLALFAIVFTLSATVVGPALTGNSEKAPDAQPTAPAPRGTTPSGHETHHQQ